MGIITDRFVQVARWTAKTEGLPDLSLVVIPYPVAGLSREILAQEANLCIDDIIQGLTKTGEKRETEIEKVLIKPEPVSFSIRGKSNMEALRAVNSKFYEEKWTDGFPIVPPTEEAVQWMLRGTDRDADEVVGEVAPAKGKATIRNIAINSVMAGAQPSYLPVIIAAVEAITDPLFASDPTSSWGLAGMQSTTGPIAPLIIVNGPVSKEVGIASGRGCFSRGHQANATIGRAVRLIMTNAGMSSVEINDMKCQGSSHEFTFCAAENEDHPVFQSKQNPWKPLHVERGYPIMSNVVTVMASWPPVNFEDTKHCGPEILNAVVDTMSTRGQEPYTMYWEYVLILSSTHAQCIADAGWSKDDIRQFIYANAVMPWGKYKQQYPGLMALQPSWIKHTIDDSTTVHIFEGPENINVIVAGSDCMYSQIVRGAFKSVSKGVRLPRNWRGLVK